MAKSDTVKPKKAKAEKAKVQDVPSLSEWMTATQIADHLGITRQSVNRMIQHGKFKTLHALGERPIYVVKRSELETFEVERADKINAREAKRSEKASAS